MKVRALLVIGSLMAVVTILGNTAPVLAAPLKARPRVVAADTGGYPYSNAVDCSAQYGEYSWCINGYDISPYGYAYRNCTDYVAWKIQQVFGVTLPKTLGNANTWGPNLKADGYSYDSTPQVGDIAAWNYGGGGFGHVAYVYAVNNGVASLDEYNVAGTGLFTSNRTTASGSAGPPSEYVHIGTVSSWPSTYEVAFQANSGYLYTYSPTHGALNWTQGMAPGTSPSIASVDGGYEIAFQANTGQLITVGAAGGTSWGLGMMPDTSPSIAALAGGGYEVAFQANTGDLWTVGAGGGSQYHGSWNFGMMARTSPSISGLIQGGYEVAFQTNTGDLWTVGAGAGSAGVAWSLGMMVATSPAITRLSAGGYEVAVQANTGDLWTVGVGGGSQDHGSWNVGMMAGTGPAITGLVAGGYEVALQTNTGVLWNVGAGSGSVNQNTGQGMAPGTSPDCVGLANGGFEDAFQANTGYLFVVGSAGNANTQQGMMALTSPGVSGGSEGASSDQGPQVTSGQSAEFTVGQPGSFTVTTSGTPTPSVAETGILPKGMTFNQAGNGTAVLSGTPPVETAGNYAVTITASNVINAASQNLVIHVMGGTLQPLTPARFLDTRNGTGAKGPVAPGATVALQVDGQGGVPASGVSAVVLNVTVTDPATFGYVTVFADGTKRPVASNLNFRAGETVPNLVIAPVGSDGKVDLYNGSSGNVQIVADVLGWIGG